MVYRITYAGLEPELGIKPRLLVYETSRLIVGGLGLVAPDGNDPSATLPALARRSCGGRLFLIENQASYL